LPESKYKLPMSNKKFGRNLRRIREGLGISQSEFAKKAKLNHSAIFRIETGEREPRLGTILKILKVTDVKFEELVKTK